MKDITLPKVAPKLLLNLYPTINAGIKNIEE